MCTPVTGPSRVRKIGAGRKTREQNAEIDNKLAELLAKHPGREFSYSEIARETGLSRFYVEALIESAFAKVKERILDQKVVWLSELILFDELRKRQRGNFAVEDPDIESAKVVTHVDFSSEPVFEPLTA